MKTTSKLSGEERREAIITAVRRLFADKGFHGTTTRELAQAAGVSEALLFKHFPNKEALYSAMLLSCCQQKDPAMVERMKALEPSASTLVFLVHRLVSHMLDGRPTGDDEQAVQHRLMLRSLLEDGEFARIFLKRIPALWISKVTESLQAAVKAGDAVAGPISPHLASWFAEHLAVTIMTRLRPETPVVDYGVPRKRLVEQTVWFALRGMGLKEEVIERHYNPKALALFAG